MKSHVSEDVFKAYLEKHGLKYEEHFPVHPGNVDFRITSNGVIVLCDVKAVTVGGEDYSAPIAAKRNIRDDLQKLKRKFAVEPSDSCVLVSMNYSSGLYSLFSIVEGMFGDRSVEFNTDTNTATLVSSPRGNSVLRPDKYGSISGVLAFDPPQGKHVYIPNPHATCSVPPDFFPEAVQASDTDVDFFPVAIFKP